ncbi:MAG: adenine nucleotide alpha hydrolase family protein [Anaerolineales bacterium]|uniref:Adenine nucleotide alpha hydrolase family protein n=1 Tax=Candidatus Desulfolinea nitratireducens TaxID=2841698 RepID=A0A8J6TIS0_9CHLR|nr:adenine nucleotide alpha hydrolase family protein [Candidatus Desulfolinea nitratireducens]MBL6961371.1 adenine nucleotide alpha hydrolase family protein [Anaerolineales bacterium]
MKCKKCGGKAVINMRQNNMGLCKDDFLKWLPEQTLKIIEKYKMFTPKEKILVAVSGGKDSLALWDILQILGYQADGLYIALGIDEGINYSAESQRLTEKFANDHDLKLHVVNIESDYGTDLPMLASNTKRGRDKPCSSCGLIKRHEMNRIARDFGYDVLATGHNLDDEAATLFSNTLQWNGDYLYRQGPVLPEKDGLARKVKPLFRFYEREMAAYTFLRGIDYIYDECPFAEGSTSTEYKEILNQLENQHPGAKLHFFVKFLSAKKKGLFAEPTREIVPELHICPSCGQPTSARDFCTFCRMMGKGSDR